MYVADCKLASRENLQHIAARGGRFLTVLPRTRGEDAAFRRRLRTEHHTVVWLPCWTRVEEPDDPRRPAKSPDDPDDVLRICAQEEVTSDGYRLLWFPLLTNDRRLTPRELLEAYQRQPKIEKRFSQLKSDFDLAPVFLKTTERVVGRFTIYFLALVVQPLMERDLRRALERSASRAKPSDRRWEGSVEVFLVNGQITLAGAQPPNAFVEAFRQVGGSK